MILVIGVGNSFRRDDGLGPAVSQAIRSLSWPGVTAVEASGEGAELINLWQKAQAVFIVDAVATDDSPGTIYRFDALNQPIPSQFFNYSTHAFSVAEAIELARVLDQLPPYLVVYGVVGYDFTAGLGLTTAVSARVDEIVDKIQADISNF